LLDHVVERTSGGGDRNSERGEKDGDSHGEILLVTSGLLAGKLPTIACSHPPPAIRMHQQMVSIVTLA
jgi:hypothetical protein